MDAEGDDVEFTIRETIELELIAIEAVISATSGKLDDEPPEPVFIQVRDGLIFLLKQLDCGQIVPEYAEIEQEKLQELLAQWRRNNPIPPD
jgi:hypothetical protein